MRDDKAHTKHPLPSAAAPAITAHVLIIADDKELTAGLTGLLDARGLKVTTSDSAGDAREVIGREDVNIALIDTRVIEVSGMALASLLHEVRPDIQCLMVIAHPSAIDASDTMEEGICGYLKNPLSRQDLYTAIDQCLDKLRLRREKSHSERALEVSENLYQSTIANMPVGIIIATPDFKLLKVNRYISEVLGYTKADLLKRTLLNLTCPVDILAFREAVKRLACNEAQTTTFETHYIHKNQTPVSATATLSLARDGTDIVRYAIVVTTAIREPGQVEDKLQKLANKVEINGESFIQAISTDILGHNRNESQLRDARDVSDNANKAKGDFLANMSHELRTPLNGILGFAQILARDKGLTKTQFEKIKAIEHNGQHLRRLVDEILDFSKIEAHQFPVNRDNFYLAGLIKSVSDITRIRSKQKNIQFYLERDTRLPKIVKSDEKLLRQILHNLLSNAVNFTRDGHVTFKISRVDLDIIDSPGQIHGQIPPAEKPDSLPPTCEEIDDCRKPGSAGVLGVESEIGDREIKIRFEVKDTGRGIPLRNTEDIFQPFKQVRSGERVIEGTGLGLSISKKLVELMGGELCVESTVGVGSCFWFDLKLTEIRAVQETPETPQQYVAGIRGRTPRVLVVDDMPENRAILTDILEPIGFIVAEAVDGLDCIQRCADFEPDLIIMDMIMPNMGGLESARRIRDDPKIKPTVVLALSGSVFETDRQRCQAAGYDDFIPKPIEVNFLLQMIRRHLDIEWEYGEPDFMNMNVETNNDQSGETVTASELLPSMADTVMPAMTGAHDEHSVPLQVADKLYDLAMKGDISGIYGLMDKVDSDSPEFAHFTTTIRKSTKSYKMKYIRDLIAPYRS